MLTLIVFLLLATCFSNSRKNLFSMPVVATLSNLGFHLVMFLHLFLFCFGVLLNFVFQTRFIATFTNGLLVFHTGGSKHSFVGGLVA